MTRSTLTCFAAVIAPLAGLRPVPAQAPPVFRAGVESVYVDVLVTRGGRPVPGLKSSHFELRDNGVRQSPELVAAESLSLLAVLVFDTSSSLVGERLESLKAAGTAFLEGLRPADQVVLVTFSEVIAARAGPTTDKALVRRALGQIEAAGATAAFDALYAGLTLAEGRTRSLVVLFTDGEDNMSFLDQRQLESAAERSNAVIHVVGWRPPGLPEPERVRTLRRIAEASGGRFWAADSPERLGRAFAAIADAMAHRYVLRYEPAGVKREGWHRIEVRLARHKGDVEARRGYWMGGLE